MCRPDDLRSSRQTVHRTLPLDENGEESEESDVYIYRFSETEDGEPNLENIEDDDEYDAAADKFDEWMDSLEFDEIDLDAE